MKRFLDRCTALMCGALFFLSLWCSWSFVFDLVDTLIHADTWCGDYAVVSVIISLVVILFLFFGAAVFFVAECFRPRVVRESCNSVYDRFRLVFISAVIGAVISLISFLVLSGVVVFVLLLLCYFCACVKDAFMDSRGQALKRKERCS